MEISFPEYPNLSLKAYPNDKGFLGRIEALMEATSLSEAIDTAYGATSSLLSVWSAQLDTPLEIAQMGGTDTVVKVVATSFIVPFPDRPFVVPSQPKMSPEFRACAGFYREALNSNSPPYQFLCLFKVLEAIRLRRATVRDAAGRVPQDRLRSSEVIPISDDECAEWLKRVYYLRPDWSEFDLGTLFPAETRGAKFGRIFDGYLYPLRVEIAHALTESGEVKISLDVLRQLRRVEKWIPVTKVMARRMLKNEFVDEFLVGLGEDGQIEPGESRNEHPASPA